MIPQYNTVLFREVYDKVDEFVKDYEDMDALGLHALVNVENIKTLYFLLRSRYANTPIANYDVNQFKEKVFSIIWQYGPTWEKRLDIQERLRKLSDADELFEGSKAIYNHAYNPSSTPSTSSLDELEYINDQNTTGYKKSKMDAYTQLWDLLNTDVTNEFLAKFAVCFKKFAQPENMWLFVNEDDVHYE